MNAFLWMIAIQSGLTSGRNAPEALAVGVGLRFNRDYPRHELNPRSFCQINSQNDTRKDVIFHDKWRPIFHGIWRTWAEVGSGSSLRMSGRRFYSRIADAK
jgi:hypothetical protein